MLINGKLSTVTLHLMPNTVIERGEHWTIATNLNQNLIGRLIVVAARMSIPSRRYRRTNGKTCTGTSAGLAWPSPRCSSPSSTTTHS